MKVSVNWLREYTDIDLPIDELVQKIGTQLGGIDEVVDLGKKYQGIVVARVMSCQKHPNADKLTVCTIDDGGNTPDVNRGENGHIQVVCGAPNVAEGMLVAWLPPRSTVPSTYDKDPLVLEAREIRGEVSNGMLASPSELRINDDHSGILEISDEKSKPGDDFAKLYGLDDYIIDIENKMFTHRPDLFGMLGIAREIAGIQQLPFRSPGWYDPSPEPLQIEAEELVLDVKNELPESVLRFTAITVSGIKVGPSPMWLQILLPKLGLKSINNIVDYTNYYMYLTAQPLHAYDYDKIKAGSKGEVTIVVRYPKPGEKIKLLNGKEIEPRSEAIMIATDKELIGIGGVMGGADTEVDENTTNIILESANFDMYSIRRTAMEHGLFTDAVTRFTKGQSPIQGLPVLSKIARDIQSHGGKIASNIVDATDSNRVMLSSFHYKEVLVEADFINSRLGLNLSSDEIETLLENVEFGIKRQENKLAVRIPFWRTDIEIREDIVEEVGRLYGYDHLPLDLPKKNIVPVGPDNLIKLKQNIRSELAKLGANEILTYSFTHGNLLDKAGQDKVQAYKITNALSPDLQYYRLSLTPSLLDKVHMNIKAGYNEFALFEIGKTHIKSEMDEEGLPREFERLAFVCSADDKINHKGSAYYQAKHYLAQLVNLETIEFDEKLLNGHQGLLQMTAPYDESRSALVWNGKMPVGIVGEFKAEVIQKFKLPKYTAGFEVFISAAQKFPAARSYQPLSRFPSISQDICLEVSEDMSYGVLTAAIRSSLEVGAETKFTIQFEPIDLYTSDKLAGKKRITYRVTATSNERTLTEDNLSSILQTTADNLRESIQAIRI